MTPDQHLAWLLHLMSPPTTNGWWDFVKARADEIAAENPDCVELPRLVREEHQRIKSAVMAEKESSATTPSEPSKPKPSSPPETTASR